MGAEAEIKKRCQEPFPEKGKRFLTPFLSAVGLAAVVFACLVFTGRDFGMVWDEAYTIRREQVLAVWFERIADPLSPDSRRLAFGRPILDRYWQFSREEPDGHPPFYALLGLAGWKLSHGLLAPLAAYRVGPILLTAIASGVVFFHLANRRGWLAAFAGSLFLLLMPRVLANAHYAHYDMPMTCLWLMAQVAFVASLRSPRWIIPFGLCLGLAAGTKFTGLFAMAGPVLWTALFEVSPWARKQSRWPGMRALIGGAVVAVATLYAIQPAWWVAPLEGPWRFLASNLTRHKSQRLPTEYLGRFYAFSLPWHNTLVLTAVTTPLGVQLLGLIGIVGCVRRSRTAPWLMIWPLSWGLLMLIRALPNAPGHDVVRQILPSLASLAVLAALGVSFVQERFRRKWPAVLIAAVALAECLVGVIRTYPYTDSYYNVAIGGLPGAERRGFELTYYWETIGPEFLRWVRREARERPIGLNLTIDPPLPSLLAEFGELPPGVQTAPPSVPTNPDYVQQRRRSFFYPEDWWLEAHGHPRFLIRREGVDLLRVYPHEQWVEAIRATRAQPLPPHLYR